MNYNEPYDFSHEPSPSYLCSPPGYPGDYPMHSMHQSHRPFDDGRNDNFNNLNNAVNTMNTFREDSLSVPSNPISYPSNFQSTTQPPYPPPVHQNDGYNDNAYHPIVPTFGRPPNIQNPWHDDTIYCQSNASFNSSERLSPTNTNESSNSCPCCSQHYPPTTHSSQINGHVAPVPNNPEKMLRFAGNGYDYNPFKSAQPQPQPQPQYPSTDERYLDEVTVDTVREALKHGVGDCQMTLRIAKMVSTLASSRGSNATQNVQMLKNENIVNVLKHATNIHSMYPQIQRECQLALTLLNDANPSHFAPPVRVALPQYESKISVKQNKKKFTNNRWKKEENGGYRCEDCGKVYRYMCNLRSHSKIHSDAAHVCEFCNKRFGRKANYIEHRRVHTGETPFPCTICNKRFKQRHSWKNHMKKHENAIKNSK
eukprot:230614_1